MARTILFIYIFGYINLYGQVCNDNIDFSIAINKDTVYRGDSMKVYLLFENRTDSSIIFYPESIFILSISHPGVFEFPMKTLTNKCIYDNIVILHPYEKYKYNLTVPIDDFFFRGENHINISYVLYDKDFFAFDPINNNLSPKEKKKEKKERLMNIKYWKRERGGLKNAVIYNKNAKNKVIIFVCDKKDK